MKKSFLSAFILFLANLSAHAATPQSFVGGSGLGLMRTAEVMGPGESSWYLNGMTSEYQSFSTPGSSALGVESTLGYARSFGGHTEISFLFPYALYSSALGAGAPNYAGSRGVTGILKHSFTDPVYEQGTAFAFTLLYTLYPGQVSGNVSSGQSLHSLEFNFSHWAQTTGFHINLGYGLFDKWEEASLPPFVATNMITGSVGVEVGLSDAMTFSLQALGRNPVATGDQDLLSSAVFTYSVSEHTIFTFGGAWGIPSNRSRPNTTYMFGISYSGQAARKTRYKIKDSNEKLATQNDIIIQKVDHIDQRVDDIDQRVGRLESTLGKPPMKQAGVVESQPVQTSVKPMETSSTVVTAKTPEKELRVELLVADSDKARVQSVEKALSQAGYKVVVGREAKSAKPKRTLVFYRDGLGEEAVHLGHKIKGNQIVVKGELPKGVDIRVQIGRDLAP